MERTDEDEKGRMEADKAGSWRRGLGKRRERKEVIKKGMERRHRRQKGEKMGRGRDIGRNRKGKVKVKKRVRKEEEEERGDKDGNGEETQEAERTERR